MQTLQLLPVHMPAAQLLLLLLLLLVEPLLLLQVESDRATLQLEGAVESSHSIHLASAGLLGHTTRVDISMP